jgi:5'-3' exoribonuclease 1
MGIPVYFKTLINNYKNDILTDKKLNNIDYLFLDLNCLIHPCCRELTCEKTMIDNIINNINKLIDYTEVNKLIFIAIDGIAPLAKMKQQKQRRYIKSLQSKYIKNQSWNTNSISPGTIFMNQLNITLKNYYKNHKIKCILSDSSERGEGEHKIIHYIKNNNINNNICIYGLDSDLIMLSLSLHIENIYLLRERTEYNLENTKSEYIYLLISKLKLYLLKSLFTKECLSKKNIIDDYIFICFLLGNDFINHIPSLNLRYNSYDLLISIYNLLQDRYQGYFYLIDREIPNYINFAFFKEFVNELMKLEKNHIKYIQSIRKKQNYKLSSKFNNNLNDFYKLFNYNNNDNILSLNDIYYYQSLNNNDNTNEMINNLPLLTKNFNNYQQDYNSDLCEDFIKSLIWNCHYYFNDCIDWKFITNFNEGPLSCNLNTYLLSINKFTNLISNDNNLTNEEQLSYIFTENDKDIHSYKLNYNNNNNNYNINLLHNRYLWECKIFI